MEAIPTVQLPTERYISVNYPLDIIIEMPVSPIKTRHSISCFVPFPKDYPMTPFRQRISGMRDRKHLAKLMLSYDEERKHLEILIFYVYSAFSDMKQYISKGEELKGFGIYMLCKVMRFLLTTPWFSKDATVSLTASGNQCYDIDSYREYTINDCLDVITPYPEILFYSLFSGYLEKLTNIINKTIPDVDMDNVYNDLDKRDIVNHCVMELIQLEEQINPEKILSVLRKLVCQINTNQRLIKNNYKRIYDFQVVENKGTEAKMIGTVASILAACDKRLYGRKRRTRSKKLKK
jgi:hypothetical protein